MPDSRNDLPGSSASQASWYELSFTVSRELADSLSDALLEAGVLSVQVSDARANTNDEEPLFGEPAQAGHAGSSGPLRSWQLSRVSILVSAPEQGLAMLDEACKQVAAPRPGPIETREIEQQDWVQLTQAQFEPIPVGNTLWITPSWHQDRPVSDDRVRIILDPGLAFGTGSHPTTRMCLQWLDQHPPHGLTVIDYGCGSGILAIAAAKLGASQVIAIDIDEQALASASENARNNLVALILSSTRQTMPAPAPLVLANILAGPLKVLAPLLEGLVLPGGTLVLAGLLDPQVEDVARAYRHTALAPWASQEGWTCLAGTRQ